LYSLLFSFPIIHNLILSFKIIFVNFSLANGGGGFIFLVVIPAAAEVRGSCAGGNSNHHQ
jgi:hypothetical protein